MTTLRRPAVSQALSVTHEGPGRATAVLSSAALVLLCDVLTPALYGATSAPVPLGWCVDESEVWRADGVRLASGRQTRRVLGRL